MPQVSLDNGQTWTHVDTVRVLYEDVEIDDIEERKGNLFLICTGEGVITDLYEGNENGDENIGTKSQTTDEIVDEIIDPHI